MARKTFEWTGPNGEKKVVSSEVEARALVSTRGGSYRMKG